MKRPVKNKKDRFAIEANWLGSFADRVKEKTGKYVVGRFKWENFLKEHQPALKGNRALEAYQKQLPERYFMFDEDLSEAWECIDEPYPQSAPDGGDWYVVPKSYAWTMVFSHEDIAFFATNET